MISLVFDKAIEQSFGSVNCQMRSSRLWVDFRGEKDILGDIMDTIARPHVVDYRKKRFDGFVTFVQGIASNEHFPCGAWSNSEKLTCAVVP